jgi:uncharacterized membrane protein
MKLDQLSRALGYFSIGLGLAEIVAPRKLGNCIGVNKSYPRLMRFLGLREIAAGVGILSEPKPAGWMSSRVLGDAMDLALLGAAFVPSKNSRGRLATASAMVLGVTALDLLTSRQLTYSKSPGGRDANGDIDWRVKRVIKSIQISRSPEELYQFWRDVTNLPNFMVHLESVSTSTDPRRSHWVAKGPAGKRIEWDAELVQDRKNELISWRTVGKADVRHAGTVQFLRAPGGRGTIVRVTMEYQSPGGVLGIAFARLFGKEPGQQVEDDLRHLKQVIETGLIPTTKGQPAGRPTGTSKKFDRQMAQPQYTVKTY